MTSPLERAARAACRSEYSDGEDEWIEAAKCRRWQMFLPQVRATIAAIREPSVDMAVIGGNRKHLGAGDMWRAMIDELLAETPAR